MNSHKHTLPRPNAYTVYLGMRAASAFAFSLVITYELVYHTVDIGLNPLQLVTVGVVLEMMTFLFEIPTGVIADSYSRRFSVLIGFLLMGIGFLVEGVVPTFAAVLAAQILWGIGFTFYSGAEAAWITDEVGNEKAHQAFLQGTQIGQIMSLVGIAAGAFLVTLGHNLPIVIGATAYLALTIVLTWAMAETGFQPMAANSGRSVRRNLLTPFREGTKLVKTRPILMAILLIGIVIGLYVGGFDRLYAAHLTTNFAIPRLWSLEPVAWFSLINGTIALLSLIGTETVRRRFDLTKNGFVANLLFTLYSGMVICTFAFALTKWFAVAVVAFCISQSLRNIGRPILIIWINQHTESPVRATVISMYWQANAFGQVIGSPIIGWIGTLFSLPAALATGTIIYTLVLPLLRRASHYPLKLPSRSP